jgi:adenosylcobinamide-phosphate guanylyltransferase
MAGGEGSRLGLGEKPLIPVCDRPMIGYVIDAFRSAGCEPVVVASAKTPMTMNWCRAHGITVTRALGAGYIEDMTRAVCDLGESGPVIISVSDIPCITPDLVTAITESYHSCGKDALSTWVPSRLVTSCRGSMPYRELVNGTTACPAGINILLGDHIGTDQDEWQLLLDEPRLALNVNTQNDLDRAESFLTSA